MLQHYFWRMLCGPLKVILAGTVLVTPELDQLYRSSKKNIIKLPNKSLVAEQIYFATPWKIEMTRQGVATHMQFKNCWVKVKTVYLFLSELAMLALLPLLF